MKKVCEENRWRKFCWVVCVSEKITRELPKNFSGWEKAREKVVRQVWDRFGVVAMR